MKFLRAIAGTAFGTLIALPIGYFIEANSLGRRMEIFDRWVLNGPSRVWMLFGGVLGLLFMFLRATTDRPGNG